MRRPRVLLADDHRLVREAFARLLEPECDVVGAVGDGRALLEAAPDLRPDIVVLDIGMPLLNGLDAARRLTQLVGDGRSQFVVLVVGDLMQAAWRFVIDDARNLDLGVLGASARAHQLDRNSMLQLIAGRVVQGLGAGLLVTAIYVVIGETYPERLRPKVFAAMSSAWVLPGLAGPPLLD